MDTDNLVKTARDTLDGAREMAEEAGTNIHEQADALARKGKELGADMATLVRDHPFAALGVAVALGLTLGMLIKR